MVPMPTPPAKTSLRLLEFEAMLAERRKHEFEEEDRILYVAMTRARDRLLLSGTVSFERWPKPTASPIAS